MTDTLATTAPEILYAPPGKPGGQPIEIDMGFWARQEARLAEVANVTPMKAPELLSTFNKAALELDRLANTVELEYQFAVRESEKVRASVLLDKVPKILQEKGLVKPSNPLGSEDLRAAILAQDAELEQACETADMLKALVKMLRGKYDAFERAFRSVRTMVGEQNFNFSNFLPDRNLSAGRDSAKPTQVGIKPAPAGFGTPKFSNAGRMKDAPRQPPPMDQDDFTPASLIGGDDIPF